METAGNRAELLKAALRNKLLEYGDRSDAIHALLELNPDFLEHELVEIASDATEDIDLIEDAGEALGLLWLDKGTVVLDKLRRIQPEARRMVLRLLESPPPTASRSS